MIEVHWTDREVLDGITVGAVIIVALIGIVWGVAAWWRAKHHRD